MSTTLSNTEEINKEFYYGLGLLSTKFAKVEANIMSLLGKLVVDEIFLINTIIEKNSLAQNIELLKRINLYREFEVDAMQDLIRRVSALRGIRNLFIHSVWGEPIFKNGMVMIGCIEPKIVSRIGTYGRIWASGKEHEFDLSFLQKTITELDLVLDIQKTLLQKIEKVNF